MTSNKFTKESSHDNQQYWQHTNNFSQYPIYPPPLIPYPPPPHYPPYMYSYPPPYPFPYPPRYQHQQQDTIPKDQEHTREPSKHYPHYKNSSTSYNNQYRVVHNQESSQTYTTSQAASQTSHVSQQYEKLPRITFPGDIYVVDHISKVKNALYKLFKDGTAAEKGIGFDMEWVPHLGKTRPNPTSIIQLATDKVCVIFCMTHLNHIMPVELFDILVDPEILKIGQGLDADDNRRLYDEFHLRLRNAVDASDLGKQKGFLRTSLKEQTRVLLGKTLSKGLCTSNWAAAHLSRAQILYAATDPYVTFLIYHELLALPDAPRPTPPTIAEVISAVADMNVNNESPASGVEVSTPCPHCDRYFMLKVQLYAHLQTAHLELLPTGPVVCELCGKKFKQYTSLKIHQVMTGHGE